ncbi:hypothetical protein CDL15_Pgr003773 [Punica granatum]|uniref:Transcription factor MYB114-like n=1 Tax=Punica granatum TaxID=22663 RepID=A0A218XV03_PUNGR|nr:hypothetical protein CDL15_Pgr003773 [Punica granatum]
MAPRNDRANAKKVMNKGAWTAEEDQKLSQYIEIHGPKRLRWLNYLRPNIKRGNISDEEEDLILRLHKLLGNRWSLIAGRLPGRTDNEIKNYWNSHLSKKINQKEKTQQPSPAQESAPPPKLVESVQADENQGTKTTANLDVNFDVNEFFDFSTGGSYGLEWVNKFLELDEDSWMLEKGEGKRGLL